MSRLSKHLEPIAVPVKESKTGKARVLTSIDCIEMLNKKQQEKEQQAIAKEERKKERERKKLEKEELARTKKEARLEQKKKKEEAALKKQGEIAARKAAKAVTRCTRAKGGSAKGVSSTSIPNLSSASSLPGPSSASSQPGPSSASSQPSPSSATSPLPEDEDSAEEDCECSFCYGAYCKDGKEWVLCACGRWVHETCVEEIVFDDHGEERFCPYCVN